MTLRDFITILLAISMRVVFCLAFGRMITSLAFPLAFEAHWEGCVLWALFSILVAVCLPHRRFNNG